MTARAAAALLAALSLLLALALARPAIAPAAPPSIRAPAAILVEPTTGDVVFQREARRERPIASTTKLMTALVTLEREKLSKVLTTVPYHALPVESVIGLRGGERMTVADLLRGLLLASANDAAATLAARVGGSNRAFVAMMNRRAHELGLTHTHYANAIGLDALGNYSSAEDLVKLTLILRRNAFFRAVTNLPRATLRTGSHPRTILNRNLLVRAVPEVNGVKTGHTSTAGYILVGSASKNGITVISVVLDEPSEAARDQDSLALIRYGLSRYHRATPVRKGEAFATRQAGPPRRARAARGGAHRRAHGAARGAPARPRARRARRARRPAAGGIAGGDDRGPLARAHDRERAARDAQGDRPGLRAAARRRPPRPHARGRDPERARTR